MKWVWHRDGGYPLAVEPVVRARYTPEVVAEVARVVGVTPLELGTPGGFESFVHEMGVPGERRIVKATWHERRTLGQLGAEHHFLNALADAGAPVCRPLPLGDGALLASVPAGDGCFHVMCYEHAEGECLTRDRWTPELFVTWGAMVGTLHRIAADYEGAPPPLSRPSWEHEYGELVDVLRDEPAQAALLGVLEQVAALPRPRTSFGPIHGDLHRHNVHWSDGQPRVFDFDDMLDFWFVSDLAIVLYYATLRPIWHGDDKQADYDQVKSAVLEGYRRERDLPDEAWASLPLFLKLREITLLAVCERSIPPEKREPELAFDMAGWRARTLSGRPPHDLAQL